MVGRTQTGEGKNSTGNVETKELICMTHRHELRGKNVDWRGECRTEGKKMGKMGQL